MIILNSVNDFKSFYFKNLLEFKGLTYINLEYSKNNFEEYSPSSTSIVYINSPVNDSEKIITKKISNVILNQEKMPENIYISSTASNINGSFEKMFKDGLISMKKWKLRDTTLGFEETEDSDYEYPDEDYEPSKKTEVVITDPYIVTRFIDELCEVPNLYSFDKSKKYKQIQFDKKFIEEIFKLFYSLERKLILTNNKNQLKLSEILNNPDKHEISSFAESKELIKVVKQNILPFILLKDPKEFNFFINNQISVLEICLFSIFHRLRKLKLIELFKFEEQLLLNQKSHNVETEIKKFNSKAEIKVVNYSPK